MKRNGFTVIELLVVIVVLGVGCWLFFSEKMKLDAVQRDNQRKVAINAMYYSLEEYYYAKFGYYPQTIDSKTLRTVDPELFTDPTGIKFGKSGAPTESAPATRCSVRWSAKETTVSKIANTKTNRRPRRLDDHS